MIYEIFRVLGIILGYPLQLLFFKRKTYYVDKKNANLKKGGKLIVSNHYNMLDYVLTCFVVAPRKLNAVASEMPFKSKITRFGMKFFGAIEANRETRSMKFVDICADVLKRGQLVQIFPEGKNTPDGKIHEFKPSYTLIAHRANVPIVLIISDGNYGLFKRTSVIISEEIDVSKFINPSSKITTKEERTNLNNYVHKRALELREELELLKNKKKGNKKC
jgi:1-acyl-sn-glycerol-3-phosphate acyltransferase